MRLLVPPESCPIIEAHGRRIRAVELRGPAVPFLERRAPLHDMTADEAPAKFPKEAGIARYGEPEQIAELTAFLVSPGARRMTGSTLRMDGGEVKSI